MIPLKQQIGEMFINKKVHYKCTCLFPIDVVGTIVRYRIDNNEVIFTIEADNHKAVEVGENTPHATIAILS